MNKLLAIIAIIATAAIAHAVSFTDVGVPRYWGKTNIPELTKALDANFALIEGMPTGVGAVAGTGATATELGIGVMHQTVITFVDTPVVMADEAGVVAYGSLKVYDLPAGAVLIHGAVSDLALTKTSTGVSATWDGDIGVGTTAAGNDGTLATTEQDIIPTTATPQAVSGATTGKAISTTATIATFDGTATAVDVYVNLLVDDADQDVTTEPCNLVLNGTLTITWVTLGDK